MSSNSLISNLNNTHFLGLAIDSALSWKDHMAELSTKLSKACYAIRTVKPFMTFNVLRTVYFRTSTHCYPMELFFRVIHTLAPTFSKYKREY